MGLTRLALHAYSITLHYQAQKMTVFSPLPDDLSDIGHQPGHDSYDMPFPPSSDGGSDMDLSGQGPVQTDFPGFPGSGPPPGGLPGPPDSFSPGFPPSSPPAPPGVFHFAYFE